MKLLIEDLIPHMRRVQAAERDLRDLSLLWQMIEASAAISCPQEAASILPMLTQTRVRFASLQARLVQQLGAESLAELRDELASTAQCSIDILVRNLFERTADVGFLATDDVLRAFCAAPADQRMAQQPALLRRLAEYRAKYSVYDDIVVLGLDGQVLARLDEQPGPARSGDPIVAQALARAAYVEQHAPSDLAAGGAPALLYGHRIAAPNSGVVGGAVGVLVLRFRQADEMQRIFASVANARRQAALLLLDGEDRVIASNDESHVPLGVRLQTAPGGEVALTTFGGREYLSVTRATGGYQGYQGPSGWRAHAMVSLLTAFRGAPDNEERGTDENRLTLDNPELATIQREVDAINADLRRVIWNGRLVAGVHAGVHAEVDASGQARLKSVLEQIQLAGARTRERVAGAIGELYRSSLARAGHQARELARLAADIMDRNLYERANDCRWWALSPLIQRELAQPASAAGSQALNALLGHVNGLYTVYSRLVVFDVQGRVRGVSNDAEQSLLDTEIDPALRDAALALADSQRYAVSAFAPSPLSGGVPTYIYLAPVRHEQAVVGGIAIVFNAEREFRAMLTDVLADRDGLAAFIDGEGRVVAGTREAEAIGSALPFDATQAMVALDDDTFVSARVAATGYREFKRSDGYQNHVQAVVALRMGTPERRREALFDRMVLPLPMRPRAQLLEFALFQVGAGRFGLPAQAVLEARPRAGLVRAPLGLPHSAGLLEVPAPRGTVVIPVLCARSLFGVHYAPRDGDGVVLVLADPQRPDMPLLGLRVDDVLSVLDVDASHLQPAPAGLRQHSPLLTGLLRLGLTGASGEVLAQMLDHVALAGMVSTAAHPATGPEPTGAPAAEEQPVAA